MTEKKNIVINKEDYRNFMLLSCQKEHYKYYIETLLVEYHDKRSDDWTMDLEEAKSKIAYNNNLYSNNRKYSLDTFEKKYYTKEQYYNYMIEGCATEYILKKTKENLKKNHFGRNKYWSIEQYVAKRKKDYISEYYRLGEINERIYGDMAIGELIDLFNEKKKEIQEKESTEANDLRIYLIDNKTKGILSANDKDKVINYYQGYNLVKEFMETTVENSVMQNKSIEKLLKEEDRRKEANDEYEAKKKLEEEYKIKHPSIYDHSLTLRENMIAESRREYETSHIHYPHSYDEVAPDDYFSSGCVVNSDLVRDTYDNINFDYENMMGSDVNEVGIDGELYGFNTINGKEFYGYWAGGDWEYPVFAIIYEYKDKLEVYTPRKGNFYNDIYDEAFGNTAEYDNSYPEYIEKYKYLFTDEELNPEDYSETELDLDNAWARLRGFKYFSYDSEGNDQSDEVYTNSPEFSKAENFDFKLIKEDINGKFEQIKNDNLS